VNASQFEMFVTESRPRVAPCGRWQRDRDGFVALPGAAPLFARKLDAADARLDAGTVVGRELQRSALAQLASLAQLGCLTWASYERIDDGPWERFPRGLVRRHPMLASVAGFAAYRTEATARLP
jgi:hypothetical protein